MAGFRIKKNDTVMAVTGISAGITGKVLHVFPGPGRAVVEGLRVVKKALRKTQDNPQGGITEKEASIHLSNLVLYCTNCKKGVKISRVKDGEKSIRKCRDCGHAFDN
ncbi:50S ribosomal protein L24 [Verrucomicrobiota bacterium]